MGSDDGYRAGALSLARPVMGHGRRPEIELEHGLQRRQDRLQIFSVTDDMSFGVGANVRAEFRTRTCREESVHNRDRPSRLTEQTACNIPARWRKLWGPLFFVRCRLFTRRRKDQATKFASRHSLECCIRGEL